MDFSVATEDEETITDAVGNENAAPALASAQPVRRSITERILGNSHTQVAGAGILGGSLAPAASARRAPVYQTFYPDFDELHDDRIFLFADDLAPGAYTYEYYLRATTPGAFSHLPAVASDLYFPENFGRTAGSTFTVEQ